MSSKTIVVFATSLCYASSLVPESICDFIDKKVRSCIWAKGVQARGWNLVPWKEVTRHKSEGGLGLRSSRLNNVALLGKLVDSLVNDDGKA